MIDYLVYNKWPMKVTPDDRLASTLEYLYDPDELTYGDKLGGRFSR